MDTIKYKQPGDIPVHFLGETQVPTRKRQQERRTLQCICFIIFRMIEKAEERSGKYAVCTTQKYNRLSIQLSNAERSIFDILEDCFSEWVVKVNGTEDDLLDFLTEYSVQILLSYERICSEIKALDKNPNQSLIM